MKIAIVCDWLVVIGGAEKLIGYLLDCFPEADLFAVIDFVEPEMRYIFHHKPIKTTFIQQLPFVKKKYRHYLPLMPLAIEQLDLSGYDIVISSSHAVAKGVITGPDQIHISYVHSPMRYAWDLQHQYLRETGLDKKLSGWVARYLLHRLRLWDVRSANGVDHFIANSHFIARRIQKTYRRDATVIYPAVDTAQFKPCFDKDDFYLAASRFVPYKKMDLIVKSFADMPEKKLIVIGDGPDFEKAKKIATPNVELLGYQSGSVLHDHLQRAKALIFAAEEDFGLVPVEAQAAGTPVIAYGKGGALETVRGLDDENPTGLFFYEQSTEAIQKAIQQFEASTHRISGENCVKRAATFDVNTFNKKIREFVEKAHKQTF